MLVLKSTSPRRKELFTSLGLQFTTEKPVFSEESIDTELPLDYLKRVTLGKLLSGALSNSNTYISSDTIVAIDQEILQKPIDKNDAFAMLRKLSGRTHHVYSGLGISYNGEIIYDCEDTEILAKNWTDNEIWNYINQFQPLDKAGAYGIQDEISPVESFKGSFWNVVGFPIRKFFTYHFTWSKYLV